MSSLRKSSLLLLFLCVGIVYGTEPPKSCATTRSAFESITVVDQTGATTGLTGRVFEDFQSVSSGICQLSETCCSSDAESSLRDYIVDHYRDQVLAKLSDSLMECHNHSFLDKFKQYIEASRANLVNLMSLTYGIYFSPYRDIFNKFYAYLQSTVDTGNTCAMASEWNEVFFEVYLAAYFGHPNTRSASQLPGTVEFRKCFFDLFLEDQSEILSVRLNGFLRTYNQTMRYLRALKRLDSVIIPAVDYLLKQECQSSIMKMTHCASCAGYLTAPCDDLCLNVMKGCLVDLSDLLGPFDEFSKALVRLQNSISIRDGLYYLWGQMSTLDSHFFTMISETFNRALIIEQEVLTACDANGRRAPTKRQAPDVGSRVPRVTVLAPIDSLNQSAYCLAEALPKLSLLPNAVCGSVLTEQASCWNGKGIGSYDRAVLEFDRESQSNNPEMVIQRRRDFEQQIANLKVATREMNILTGNYQCGVDDEDEVCSIPPTCEYYGFVDAPYTEVEFSGSGSGSDGSTTVGIETTPTPTEDSYTTASTGGTDNDIVTDISTTMFTPTRPGGGTDDDIVTDTSTTMFTPNIPGGGTDDDIVTEGPGTGPGGTVEPTAIVNDEKTTLDSAIDDEIKCEKCSAMVLSSSLVTIVLVLCSVLLL